MTRLFIENKEVELDNSLQFAITKQYEDITNPTVIINEWSKSVDIPFTKRNNEIFDSLWSEDKVITSTNFNPYQKICFRLEWGDNVLMQGYLKVNEVKKVDGKGYYNITLFGELGRIFSEMKKITFDTKYDEEKYIIQNPLEEMYFNRDTIYNFWSKTRESAPSKMVGFAPNNAKVNNFDYTSYQLRVTSPENYGKIISNTFENALGDDFYNATNVKPSVVTKDGLLPRQIGEYRSYLQLPYIYVDSLFSIFFDKCRELGINIDFDERSQWKSNVFFKDVVMMLEPAKIDSSNIDVYKEEFLYTRSAPGANNFATTLNLDYINHNTIKLDFNILNSYIENGFKYAVDIEVLNLNAYLIEVKTTKGIKRYYIVKDINNLPPNLSNYMFTNGNDGTYEWHIDEYYLNDTAHATFILENVEGIESIQARWWNSEETFRGTFTFGNTSRTVYPNEQELTINYTNLNSIHSGTRISLNELWNNDYNLFDTILNYCKMCRLMFIVEGDGKVRLIESERYFKDFKILDYTDKLDLSKDFNIKPITFEKKYVKFNYDDSDIEENKTYKERYGLQYGEYRLKTEYNFDNDTIELFEGVKQPFVYSPSIMLWSNLYNFKTIVYRVMEETFVKAGDKDNNIISPFGQLYFFKGIKSFALDIRDVVISDDTVFQYENDTIMYSQNFNSKAVLTYPYLDITTNRYSLLFGTPHENYNVLDTTENKQNISMMFWSRYLDERYDIQNKIVTCYLKLKPQDYINFEFNNFIRIDNQVYFVNKIYDYNINNTESTKVDLITIQDTYGYL